MEKILYRDLVLNRIFQIFSQEDREFFSPTFGCFDRAYWQWKFKDFPNARFQEAVLILTLLYLNNFSGNLYFKKSKILDWIIGGIKFWCKIQNKDGSFDEAYPYERSFVATAFSTYCISESYILLKKFLDNFCLKEAIYSLEKAGEWLINNDERHAVISNHLGAAISALNNLYNLTNKEKYKKRSNYFLRKLIKYQSKEGWFSEYDGPDIGYQTLTTFFLVDYYKKVNSAEILTILRKSLNFLINFIYPNGTIGGEIFSRNTEFYFPAGFEILSKEIYEAKWIADRMYEGMRENNTVSLNSVDEYNFIPMLMNLLIAFLESKESKKNKNPYEFSPEEFICRYYKEAQIYLVKNKKFYFILGVSKGGICRIYNNVTAKLIYSDCGYICELSNGKLVSNQFLTSLNKIKFNDKYIEIESSFFFLKNELFYPIKFIFFRICLVILARLLPLFSRFIKKLLVKRLILKRKKAPLILIRKIEINEDVIKILDSIILGKNIKLKKIYKGSKFATIHMGSSRYFQIQELDDSLSDHSDYLIEQNNKIFSFYKEIRII